RESSGAPVTGRDPSRKQAGRSGADLSGDRHIVWARLPEGERRNVSSPVPSQGKNRRAHAAPLAWRYFRTASRLQSLELLPGWASKVSWERLLYFAGRLSRVISTHGASGALDSFRLPPTTGA